MNSNKTDGESTREKAQSLSRLLFETYKKLVEVSQVKHPATPSVREAWFSVLGTKDERIILRTFDTLHEALDRLEAAMSQAPDQTGDTIAMVGGLIGGMRDWINIGYQQRPSNTAADKTPLDQLRFLLFVESAIARNFPELQLSRSAMGEVVEKLKEMDDILADPEIPPMLKAMLHELVGRMRWAVQHYDTVGVDGLLRQVRAAELTLVHLIKLNGRATASAWVMNCIKKIKKISDTIAAASNAYEKISAVADAVQQHLPSN
jgi:hypothetical protein